MNFDESMLEQLILDGIVEFAGLTPEGEMLYNFSEDLEEKAPAIFKMMMEIHTGEIHMLWEKGFLQMDVTKPNPLVNITEKALDPEEVDRLPKELQVTLRSIMDRMREW